MLSSFHIQRSLPRFLRLSRYFHHRFMLKPSYASHSLSPEDMGRHTCAKVLSQPPTHIQLNLLSVSWSSSKPSTNLRHREGAGSFKNILLQRLSWCCPEATGTCKSESQTHCWTKRCKTRPQQSHKITASPLSTLRFPLVSQSSIKHSLL